MNKEQTGGKEFQIAMLGASGVGKTTLLTSMYEQFEKTTGEVNLQLKPADAYSKGKLEEYLKQLRSIAETFEAKRVIRGTTAMGGPAAIKPFRFELGKKGDKPSLQLCFRDYPGGFISSTEIEEKRYVRKLLARSAAVVIPVDTPAIMEVKGRWNDLINKPDEIIELFKVAYQKLEEPKLVILAPVKCESYVENEEAANLLRQRIEKEYDRLLEFFRSPGVASKVTVVVAPVQTVGCVIFHMAGERNGEPVFYFTKKSFYSQYKPQNSEELLRYLLRFLLKLHVDRSRWPVLQFVREMFDADAEFKQAVEQFAKSCKTNEGFAVLQGEQWLKL